MSVTRFGLGLGLGLGMAVEAFSGHAQAQPVPPGSPRSTASPSTAAPSVATPTAATPTAGMSAPLATPSAAVSVNAPDVVRLKNGGLLRGTISELVPGDFVAIVLITGESRKVPYADVQYAGSANDPANSAAVAPSPPTAAPTATGAAAQTPATAVVAPVASNNSEVQPFVVVHARESRVEVTSSQKGVTLFRRAASAQISGGYGRDVSGYEEVCTVPCTVSMPAGTHTFAVAKPGGTPREAGAVTLPAGSTNMAISYVDRAPIRIGMGLVGVGTMIAGFALLLSDSGNSNGSENIAGPLVLVSAGGGLLGLAFVILDGSKVTVGPGVAAPHANNPSNGSNRWLDQRAQDANSRRPLSGLTITAQF